MAISDNTAGLLYRIASTLTTPICSAHGHYWSTYIVDELNPQDTRVVNIARKCFHLLSTLTFGTLALFTSLPGAAIKGITNQLHPTPFLSLRGIAPEKQSPSNTFTLLSWNICCVAGGYPITDGGVTLWQQRIHAIAQRIKEQDTDVVCLYEAFDTDAAFSLYNQLKNQYPHFHFNIGPQAIGVCSGIFVASKFPTQNTEFTPFPQDMLVGRTKKCAKGVFAFDIPTTRPTRIYATHLQHSEQVSYPEDPEDEEVEARRKEVEARYQEMLLITRKISRVREKNIILTGDLNLDDDEREASFWNQYFIQNLQAGSPPTWGGDEHSARDIAGKRPSYACNLDYTMTLKEEIAPNIHTTVIPTGFDPTRVQKEALSDHSALRSLIHIT